MGKLASLKLDEATFRIGAPVRQHEWELICDEIAREGAFEKIPAPVHAVLHYAPGQVALEINGARHPLPLDVLRPNLAEYMDICQKMVKLGLGSNSPQLEALDIAKRITHDDAGETIRAALREIGPDLPTSRQIFTLLVTLFYDTTQLSVPPHRMPHF
jgi:uncharacterized protein (UPF0262 family)